MHSASARFLALGSLFVGLAGAAHSADPGAVAGSARGGAAADAAFEAIYRSEWAWREAQLPDDEDTRKPIADHLPDMSAAAQEARLRYWLDVRRRLDAVVRAELSPAERLNFDVYGPQIDVLIANQRFRDYEMPANSDTTFWTNLGYTARRPFRTLADYRNWLSQMHDIPRYFRQQTDAMRAGLRRGLTPPRVTMQGRDASLTAVTEVAAEQSLFYVPFRTLTGIGEAQRTALRAEAVAVIRDRVQPAYRELLEFMRHEYVPHLRTTLAARDLPNGEAFYRAKIREFTTLDLTPEAIHAIGLREVARLRGEMGAAMRETGFEGELPAFLSMLRTDTRFYAKTPQELLDRAAWIAKKFDGKAAQFFGYLPRARFAIEPVPDDIAPFYTAGRGGAGLYLVNTYDLPSRPSYSLTALTLHESAPGHAFQLPIALEHRDQPEFRQQTYLSAYGEGWALYCEMLGVEMGMYETPYDRFGMLAYQIWRAARLVVDTGIHAEGWSRERAIAYFRDNTALADHEIETEIDRYIAWPAQALSYYLGEMTLLDARAKAQAALGERFNLRAFHDTVLELGSVPMPVLTERIDRFIAEGGKGPYPEME